MTIIDAQIPEPSLEQARALAKREGIPLEQIISLTVTQQFAPVEAGARGPRPLPRALPVGSPLMALPESDDADRREF